MGTRDMGGKGRSGNEGTIAKQVVEMFAVLYGIATRSGISSSALQFQNI